MTVHFAAARTPAGSPVARILGRHRPCLAANDNYTETGDADLMRAALLHFAKHGLKAAGEAKREAESAFFAGNRTQYLWWLGVCRTLDQRIAAQMERNPAG